MIELVAIEEDRMGGGDLHPPDVVELEALAVLPVQRVHVDSIDQARNERTHRSCGLH